MSRIYLSKPYRPTIDVPDELEAGTLPVEPDDGQVPTFIPDDPESDRIVAPVVMNQAQSALVDFTALGHRS